MARAFLLAVAGVLTHVALVGEACPYFQRHLKDLYEGSSGEEPGSAATERFLMGCGQRFCYGRMLSIATHPPFQLPYSELVQIGLPNTDPELFNYMEDSQARSDQLFGFELNIGGPSSPAGYTYLGQLLSHDMNLDETSALGETVPDPSSLPNSNTPFLDLDTLYNFKQGNSGQPSLPSPDGKFPVNGRDFVRQANGEADIMDLRNDEHRIISQLTVAFMTLHNMFVDACTSGKNAAQVRRCFLKARQETIQVWQSVILTDLLPNLVDVSTVVCIRTAPVMSPALTFVLLSVAASGRFGGSKPVQPQAVHWKDSQSCPNAGRVFLGCLSPVSQSCSWSLPNECSDGWRKWSSCTHL